MHMSPHFRQSWMFGEALALLQRAERLQRHFMDLVVESPRAERRPVWEPPINLYRSDDALVVVIALPGAAAEQVRIHERTDGLLVEALVEVPPLPARGRVERLEIPYGLLRRHVRLPRGRYRLTEHSLSNGCLYLRLQENSP